MPNGRVMRWKDADFPTVYANLMGFGMTPFDISLLLGEVGESTDTEVVGIPRVKVLLSPEQANNLHKLLGLALTKYVETNGALRTVGAVDLDELNKQVEQQNKPSTVH